MKYTEHNAEMKEMDGVVKKKWSTTDNSHKKIVTYCWDLNSRPVWYSTGQE